MTIREVALDLSAYAHASAPYHHLTVDVEEYFHVAAWESHIHRSDWSTMTSRIDIGLGSLLELLERHGARATFFVLGWLAERRADLVRRISDAGHEIASHGWNHMRVTELTPLRFRYSVRRARGVLQSITGMDIAGFRAPSFSIVPGLEWALETLVQEGHTYDSSIFPANGRRYGYPGARRDPYVIHCDAGSIVEMPPATLRCFGLNIPAAGGGYLRNFPLKVVSAAITSAERRSSPATLYVHPWELDPEQPRSPHSWGSTIRHYTGLSRTASRLERLLETFTVRPIADTMAGIAVPGPISAGP